MATLPQTHTVTITVNEQAIDILGPRVTGLQIKEAAISQGVPMDVNFILSEELPNNRTRIIGDDDVVTVNSRSRFLAIANDDNS